MIDLIRSIIGAILGALAAGVALRAQREARHRGVPVTRVLGDLPDIIRTDADRVSTAAHKAYIDGRRAAARRRIEIDSELASIRHREEQR